MAGVLIVWDRRAGSKQAITLIWGNSWVNVSTDKRTLGGASATIYKHVVKKAGPTVGA